MATIRERKNGTVQITVSAGFGKNGKQVRKYMTYKPKETAKKKREQEIQAVAKAFEDRIKNGESIDADKITFDKFLEVWEKEWASFNINESTVLYYKQLISLYVSAEIGSKKLSQIKGSHIQRILNGLNDSGLSPATVRRVNTAMHSVFRYAVSMEMLDADPCANRALPRSQKSTNLHHWELPQIKAFLSFLEMPVVKDETVIDVNTVSTQFRAFFNVSIFGGLRCQEIIALRWDDVNFEENTISIVKAAGRLPKKQIIKSTKTPSAVRTIVLPDSVFDILAMWKEEQKLHAKKVCNIWEGYKGKSYDRNFIFIQNNGKMMDLTTPSHKFRKLIDSYNDSIERLAVKKGTEKEQDEIRGLKLPVIRLHDLRHTNATMLISAGTDILTVSHRLGHAQVSTTLNIYSHWLQSKDKTASDALDALFNESKETKKDEAYS